MLRTLYSWTNVIYKKRFQNPTTKLPSWKEIFSDNLDTYACTDLGAYYKSRPNNLKGIRGVVIMEDRQPNFFMTYKKYQPNKDTSLNRHGPIKELSAQKDLKSLITELHAQEIKVYLGFWGFIKKNSKAKWIKNFPELLNNNPLNPDVNPFVYLKKQKMTFAECVSFQYQKIKEDFSFDGLHLGDGLNGYRWFSNPNFYRDKENTSQNWADFYKKIAETVHKSGGELLAYDLLGFVPNEARLHGADYKKESKAGLDTLVVQTYPIAWGKYWLKGFDGFDFNGAEDNLKSVYNELKNTKTKVWYTLELGDTVEGWFADINSTRKQLREYKKFADGKFLVWANDLFAKRNK